MIDPEEFMKDLAIAMEEEDVDIEEFIHRNNIKANEIDSYVVDADDHGYTQYNIWKVEQEEPFYFIYEWNTYYNGEPSAIFLAEPFQTTRYYVVSDNYREMYRDGELY